MPIKIFFCYAHRDERLLNKLKTHLKPLQRQGHIEVWYDRDINAGEEWMHEIDAHLNTADIILLLVSPDFMDSEYCYAKEMKRALERHDQGEACVIPVILRHVYWHGEPLGKLQALPTDAKPVTDPNWFTQDRAFYNVTQGIIKAIDALVKRRDLLTTQLGTLGASILSRSISQGDIEKAIEAVQASFKKIEVKSLLKISIMGQTGVGKTALINMLFNTSLEVHPILPNIKRIQEINIPLSNDRHIHIYDLAGIGESLITDKDILDIYRQKLLESDVVIWAIQADSRLFTFDYTSLTNLLDISDTNQQINMLSKIIFVLTKVDLLNFSWIFANDGKNGVLRPAGSAEDFIRQKLSYFTEKFLMPLKHLIKCRTYFADEFDVIHPQLSFTDQIVYYDGFLGEEERDKLKISFPKYKNVFDNLYDSCHAVPCSARFKYNLDFLMKIIMQKIEPKSAIQLSSFIERATIKQFSLSEVKIFHNILFYDSIKGTFIGPDDINL